MFKDQYKYVALFPRCCCPLGNNEGACLCTCENVEDVVIVVHLRWQVTREFPYCLCWYQITIFSVLMEREVACVCGGEGEGEWKTRNARVMSVYEVGCFPISGGVSCDVY